MQVIEIAKQINNTGFACVAVVALSFAIIKLYRDNKKLNDKIIELHNDLAERADAEIGRAEVQVEKHIKLTEDWMEIQSRFALNQESQMKALEIILKTGGRKSQE